MMSINSSPSAIDYGHIGQTHEYAVFYAKNLQDTKTNQLPEKDKKFKYTDEIGPFNLYPLYNGNIAFNPKTRPNLYYPFYLNPQNPIGDDFFEIGRIIKSAHPNIPCLIVQEGGYADSSFNFQNIRMFLEGVRKS